VLARYEAVGGEEIPEERAVGEVGRRDGEVGVRGVLGDGEVGVASVEVDSLSTNEDDSATLGTEGVDGLEQGGTSPHV
jgi:hypothetical protein